MFFTSNIPAFEETKMEVKVDKAFSKSDEKVCNIKSPGNACWSEDAYN